MARIFDPLPLLTALGWRDAHVLSQSFGFSGATVWKVDADGRVLALKAYPKDWDDLRRLQTIHDHLRRATAVNLLPQPVAPPIDDQGRLWDAVDWRDGEPLSAAPAECWSAAGAAVARLHQLWHEPRLPVQVASVVLRHWQALASTAGINPAVHQEHALAEGAAHVQRLRDRAMTALRPWLNRHTLVQTVHGDLWSGNVLMRDDTVAAIIDHGSIRVDSIVADVARLSEDHKTLVLAGYESVRPLSIEEIELLSVLAVSGPIVRLIHWLKWLTVEKRAFPDPSSARARFLAVLNQVRGLA